ncbi:hypothetical protein NDU88_009824 [Pleurodeles waltl]|uniref:Uncharacterized protein n=1 Tax=Pleurodeles waltl TaxID=8319 RepID=A0AAV7Q042_PLEWA|nr:hypothetical protein NDU88_009824 [Pleurodeles waltl]
MAVPSGTSAESRPTPSHYSGTHSSVTASRPPTVATVLLWLSAAGLGEHGRLCVRPRADPSSLGGLSAPPVGIYTTRHDRDALEAVQLRRRVDKRSCNPAVNHNKALLKGDMTAVQDGSDPPWSLDSRREPLPFLCKYDSPIQSFSP